ncbi:YdeI/OmpD-associated family protein [Paraneptunicella aestuarii]|uniref:YdeI/OmpD-associated family protein n=1 Tax=Paraneptunicella aestuarii TaxID=2831148 RepID=UPI001E368E7E|nr:YdeI/OmpD-associated family protein [Paraneptunicella aestuarii]UAA37180.1 YdeI/OmpD-associated family protein [Paraneptunicella aestuarii]
MLDILFFKESEEFSEWLEQNHRKASEVWVGFYKKESGKVCQTWSESVDVALCFGWIDGLRKSIDEQSYKIRFTPRKSDSVWSAVNVKKVEELIKLGKMKPEGLKLFNSRTDSEGYSSDKRNLELDDEYEQKLRENPKAWQYFSDLAPSYKRDTIWWVMSAKREDTRLRRLDVLITSSEEGKKIPFLGGK